MAQRRTNKDSSFSSVFDRIVDNVDEVIRGKQQAVRMALACMIAEGHLLIEDVPGVGKTSLAKALARSTGCDWRRVQFTPDLLPTDITGASVFDPDARQFEFRQGAIFSNIVLADEINRASPKTQSALLEAMEERQVTADGVTHPLPSPFLAIATQNPIEHEGTYPLPFAQLDRFMMRLSLGYPDFEAEMDVLERHGGGSALEELTPVCDTRTITSMIGLARQVRVEPSVREYIVTLVTATRDSVDLSLGASPRAALALMRCARVLAAASGRSFTTPDDVKALARSVLAHRVMLSPEAEMSGRTAEDVVDDLLRRVPVAIGR